MTTWIGTDSNDSQDGGSGADILDGAGGDDTINGLAGADSIMGENGNDVIHGGDGADVMDGDGQYPDKSNFYSGADKVYGDAGNDIIYGGAGNDTLDGGADNDILYADVSALSLTSSNTIYQTAFPLRATSGDDSVSGGDGDDTIISTVGTDTLSGGAGTDLLTYDRSTSSTAITLDVATSAPTNIGDGSVVSGFERLSLNSGTGDDHITGGALADFVDAHAGNDVVMAGDGANTVYAGAGDDTITAGSGNDLLYADRDISVNYNSTNIIDALSGNDHVDAGGGDDTVQSTVGQDTLFGGGGTDVLVLQRVGYAGALHLDLTAAGTHTLDDGSQIDGFERLVMTSGDGDDVITGGALNDVIDGRNGADLLSGGDGADTLYGGEGGDTLLGGDGGDRLRPDDALTSNGQTAVPATGGNDSVDAGAGDDTVWSGIGTDTLEGGFGTDLLVYAHVLESSGSTVDLQVDTASASGVTISGFEILQATGGSGADSFSGGLLNDTLNGGLGNDTLDGRGGVNILFGGGGVDTVSYADAPGGVHVDLRNNDVQQTSPSSIDTIQWVENVTGSAGADTLIGGVGDNLLSGGDGDDVLNGDASTGAAVSMVSSTASGAPAAGVYLSADLSGDGEHVVMVAQAPTLGGLNTSQSEVYVKDLSTGAVVVASSDSAGNAGDNNSTAATFAAAAPNLVAFESLSSNLSGSDSDGTVDVFLKNLATGQVTLVSSAANGTGAETDAHLAGIQADGSHVAFISTAANLDNTDSNGVADLYIKDVASGAVTRVATMQQGELDQNITYGQLSNDGSEVLYLTAAKATSGDTDNATDAFVKNLSTGVITDVSANESGRTDTQGVGLARLSGNGEKVLFVANDDLIAGDTNGIADIYVRDLSTGTLTLVNTDANGVERVLGSAYAAAISADGRHVAFDLAGSGDQPGGIFVKDLVTGALTSITSPYGQTYDASLQSLSFSTDGTKLMVSGLATPDFTDTGYTGAGVLVFDLTPPENDTLAGGAGNDTASYADAASGVHVSLLVSHAQDTGGAGTDTLTSIENLVGSAYADVLAGSGGDNLLAGGAGADTLSGGAGKDTLDGGAGDDLLNGGTGKNLLSYATASGAVKIDLSVTTAQTTGGAGTDTVSNFIDLAGSAFNDRLTGNDDRNHIVGGDGKDVIHGGAGNDNLQGELGSDTLEGGLGRDQLNGGAGADTYLFDHVELVSDVIRKVTPGDVIDLHLLDANTTVAGDQAFTLVDHFHNHAGEARLNYQAGQDVTLLQLDTDGDGKSNMTITLDGQHTDFSDFVL